MSSGTMARSTALRAGGACVRCRKGKTKCVYENNRPPCKNCAKGMHDCYLPSEHMAHHHGSSPARHGSAHRPARDSLPASGAGGPDARQAAVASGSSARHAQVAPEKLTSELLAECERVVCKTFPACVAFHKPSFMQQLKNATLQSTIVYGLLTCAARSSPALIRRYGSPTQAAETFASKAMTLINQNLDHPNLADIQALCIIVIHEWGTRNAIRAYIYLGQAARMLHMYRIMNTNDAPEHSEDHFLREESLRRTFWLVYILDCLLTTTAGRLPALSPQDTVDVPLPCADLNFAFDKAVQVKTLHQHFGAVPLSPTHARPGEVGEFGYIVLASTIWRDVVGMLSATTPATFLEQDCAGLLTSIEDLRASLPEEYVDKPGKMAQHMFMGSGFTFAMLHCLLHCATIFVHRRCLLQDVISPEFDYDYFCTTARCRDLVDSLFKSCHGTISLLDAVEAETKSKDDEQPASCLPIVMLFSTFTASATVAYLSLKGLTPPHAVETSAQIVRDGLEFMRKGTETWPLMSSWLRHLSVMQRVLNTDVNGSSGSNAAPATDRRESNAHRPGVVQDEVSSDADDTLPDAMDSDRRAASAGTDQPATVARSVSGSARGDSEPPMNHVPRRGVTTINGGSGALSASAAAPLAKMQPNDEKRDTLDVAANNGVAAKREEQTPNQEMTAPELCKAFERQLLDLDDLAAFMGGGV